MKSGFIAIIGRPNAGKSTLLNALVEQKIAIVTPTVQTTRNNIQGIRTEEDCQYIFIDTPGIHKPKHLLGATLNRFAYNAMQEVDVIYWIVDASAPFGKGDEFVLEKIKNTQAPVFLLVNKIDLLSKDGLIDLLIEWEKRYTFAEIIPVSALKHHNLKTLLSVTKSHFEEGVQYFPSDMKSDHPRSFIMKELIREKVIFLTKEEIPHSVAIVIEKFVEKEHLIIIQAMILVERKSQKPILVGKQGNMIKEIGISTRKDLELMFGKKVHLELFVRVEEDWRNKESKLKDLGYNEYE